MKPSRDNTAVVKKLQWRWSCAAALLLLGFLLGPAPAYAQLTTGTIAGTVIDETKSSLPGTAVTVKHADTGLTRTVFTNERGFYEATNLPVGNYEVSAALSGFGTATRKDVQLAVGRTVVIDLTLNVGNLAQEVTVTGAAPLIETTSATVSNLIDSKRVEDLPLVNRDLTQLAFIQPGVVKIPSSGNAGVFSGMGDKFTVAGARGTQNLYLLDGVSNADLSGNAQGASGSYMGSETVQEIQIVTNNYSAEYRSAAGRNRQRHHQVGHEHACGARRSSSSATTRSTHRTISTRSSTSPKSQLERNQYGGSFGGPIKRDKMFFFASYEGLVEDRSRDTDTATVFSANARAGRLRKRDGRRRSIRTSSPISPSWPIPGVGNTIVQDFGDTVLIAGTGSHTDPEQLRAGEDGFQPEQRQRDFRDLQLRQGASIALRSPR